MMLEDNNIPGELADINRRCIAFAIDFILFLVVALVTVLSLGLLPLNPMSRNVPELNFSKLLAANIIVMIYYWLYSGLMESSIKQATLGKMIMGLIVTDLGGRRISFGRATGRFLSKFFLSGQLMIGYIMILFTTKRQGLHDLIAGTLVLKKQQTVMGVLPQSENHFKNYALIPIILIGIVNS